MNLAIVDDSGTGTLDLQAILEGNRDFHVVDSGNSSHFLAWLAHTSHLPDLVLVDVSMPRDEGLGLIRLLKAAPHTRDIPIIAVTDPASEHRGPVAMSAGAAGFLGRPLVSGDFLARLEATAETQTPEATSAGAEAPALETELGKEWRRASRLRRELSLLLIRVATALAHPDSFDKAIRACLRRPTDRVFNREHADYAVLLPATNASGALAMAERILAHVNTEAPAIGEIHCGTATTIPSTAVDAGVLFRLAQEALEEAVDSGRAIASRELALPFTHPSLQQPNP